VEPIAHELYERLAAWLQDLGFATSYVGIFVVAAAIVTLVAALYVMYRCFFSIRRWLRRKRIPKNIDLNLDREIAPVAPSRTTETEPVASTEGRRPKLDHGDGFRENLDKMRGQGPYGPKQRNDA
jgi:hypothetical protein